MVKLNKNEFVNTWQWQNFMFEENIETIEKGKKSKEFENLYQEEYKNSDWKFYNLKLKNNENITH